MGFLEDNCYICPVKSQEDIVDFTCGDCDLDDFFAQDCFAYSKQLLGKTYCFKTDDPSQKVVCAFTLANSGVNVSRLPNARKKKAGSKYSSCKNTERLSRRADCTFRSVE